jgi:aerobic carbon-monoxide dehydrogenase small subunit
MNDTVTVSLTVNGLPRHGTVEARRTLADFLREDCLLTGTHLGCEHGVCGACTILLDGAAVRSCLVLATQAEGRDITTIEGVAAADGSMHPLQEALWESHSFQCGFCTSGFVMSALALINENPEPTEGTIREALSGNLCRCTGYASILAGVKLGAERMKAAATRPWSGPGSPTERPLE